MFHRVPFFRGKWSNPSPGTCSVCTVDVVCGCCMYCTMTRASKKHRDVTRSDEFLVNVVEHVSPTLLLSLMQDRMRNVTSGGSKLGFIPRNGISLLRGKRRIRSEK